MRVAILAGGKGSRLGEGSAATAKPLVRVASKPIIWHVMSLFAVHGFVDFVVAVGHRGRSVARWFSEHEDWLRRHGWSATIVPTGVATRTGGRLLRLRELLQDETFLVAYCDGVAALDVPALVDLHRAESRLATVVATHPPPRFGELTLDGSAVLAFQEKPQPANWVNGGFFVLEPSVFNLITDDRTSWERDTLPQLAAMGQLSAFRHDGFWHCMDTPADHSYLQSFCVDRTPPWPVVA